MFMNSTTVKDTKHKDMNKSQRLTKDFFSK